MTQITDKQLASLKATFEKAVADARAIEEKHQAERKALRAKHYPRESAAEKAVYAARAALETAELARLGITPEHTVLRVDGKLWAVRISEGWPIMVPLKADCSIHQGRNEDLMPRRRERWQIVAGKVMKK